MFSEKIAFPTGEIDREKVGGCGDVRSAISDRVYSIGCWADETLAQPTALQIELREFNLGTLMPVDLYRLREVGSPFTSHSSFQTSHIPTT